MVQREARVAAPSSGDDVPSYSFSVSIISRGIYPIKLRHEGVFQPISHDLEA